MMAFEMKNQHILDGMHIDNEKKLVFFHYALGFHYLCIPMYQEIE